MADFPVIGASSEILPGRFGEPAGEAGVRLCPQDGIALALMAPLRGRAPELAARLQEAFGIALPRGPRWTAGKFAVVGIGPDRWLALHQAPAEGFVAALAKLLAGIAAVTDQSDAQVILDLAGEQVRDLLAKGLSIDLDPLAFAADAAVVSTMAQIPVTLWQKDPTPIYRIAVPRSWIGSFLHWLGVSAAEFGLQILPAEDRVARGLRSEAGGAANAGRSLG